MSRRHPLLLVTALLGAAGLYFGWVYTSPQSPTPTPATAATTPTSAVAQAPRENTPVVAKAQALRSLATAAGAAQPGFNLPSTSPDWRREAGEELRFTLPGGGTATFRRTATRTVGDREVWVGKHPTVEGAFAILTASRTGYSSLVSIPGLPTYETSLTAGGQERIEESTTDFHCGTCEGPATAAAPIASTLPASFAAAAQVAGAALTVDVVFIYDQGALTLVNNDKNLLESRLITRLEAGNVVLANSLVTNFTWKYVGAFLAEGYVRTGKLNDDLDELTDEQTSLGGFAKEKADLTGADQIVLMVGNPIDWGGLAWVPGNHSVVGFSQLPYYTLIHELGHNFGCNHDRQTQNATDGDGRFYYGHRYNDSNGNDTGTVMSYASRIIPYFSNPNVTYNGFATGVAENQPKAAYNARKLRDYAPNIAAKRTAVTTPVISTQPLSQTVTAGESVVLNVGAIGTGLTYQWTFNGTSIAGANSQTLSLGTVSSLEAGSYACVVSGGSGALNSQAAEVHVLPLLTPNTNARLVNLSTRSLAGQGFDAQIAGFTLQGGSAKEVLVRASGPALTALGVGGAVTDPNLELRRPSDNLLLAANDNWSSSTQASQLSTAFSQAGAFGWAAQSKDAALLASLTSGNYTGIVSSKDGALAVSLIEVYETSSATAGRLINISTRGTVGRDGGAQIAGFVIGGSGIKTLLVRASGPALAPFLPGATVVDDPAIDFYRQGNNTVAASNDDWGSDNPADIADAAASSGAFGWTFGSPDAALLLSLKPGAYTAVVQAKGAGGVGLVEVYDVNR